MPSSRILDAGNDVQTTSRKASSVHRDVRKSVKNKHEMEKMLARERRTTEGNGDRVKLDESRYVLARCGGAACIDAGWAWPRSQTSHQSQARGVISRIGISRREYKRERKRVRGLYRHPHTGIAITDAGGKGERGTEQDERAFRDAGRNGRRREKERLPLRSKQQITRKIHEKCDDRTRETRSSCRLYR